MIAKRRDSSFASLPPINLLWRTQYRKMLRETARAKTHTQQPTREVKESGKKERRRRRKNRSLSLLHTHTHTQQRWKKREDEFSSWLHRKGHGGTGSPIHYSGAERQTTYQQFPRNSNHALHIFFFNRSNSPKHLIVSHLTLP